MSPRRAPAPVPVAALVVLGGLLAVDAAAQPPDRDRLRREAGAMPPSELEARIGSPVREVRLAAIAAADASPDAPELLDELAVAAGGWDRSVAAPAARAARAIARRLVGGQGGPATGDLAPGEPAELDVDEVAAAEAAWLALARRSDRWSDVRVHALEVVASLAAWRTAGGDGAAGYDLAPFAAEPDPEVARAAIELVPVPAPLEARPILARAVGRDEAVGLAAAQALCAGLPRDAAAVLVALGPPGLARLRELVAPPPGPRPGVVAITPGAAHLDAARCLAADPDPASRRALEVLRHRLPRGLRATLAAIVDDVGARARPTSP